MRAAVWRLAVAFVGVAALVASAASSALAFGQVAGSPFAIPADWLQFLSGSRLQTTSGISSVAISAVSVNPSTGALTPSGQSPFDTSNGFFPGAINSAGTMLAAFSGDPEKGGIATYSVNPDTGATSLLDQRCCGSEGPIDSPTFDTAGDLIGYIPYGLAGTPPPPLEVEAVNPTTGALGAAFSSSGERGPVSAAFSKDARFVAVGGVVDVATLTVDKSTHQLRLVSDLVINDTADSVAFSPDGRWLAASTSGGVYMFSVDTSSGALTEVSGSPFAGGTRQLAFNDVGDRLAVDSGSDVAVYALNPGTGVLNQVVGSPFPLTAPPGTPAFSPDGSWLAVPERGDGIAVFSTAASPPAATITSPADNAVVSQGQAVPTTFSCSDGSGGPGIASCVDSAGSNSPGLFDTSTPGAHVYTVTATSLDGATAAATVHYTVIAPATVTGTGGGPPGAAAAPAPSNHFAHSRLRLTRSGVLSLRLTVPGPGLVQVLETAPKHTSAHATSIQVPANRYAFASLRRRVDRRGTFRFTVKPGRRGRRLIRRRHPAIPIRAYITYTPSHGRSRTSGPITIRLAAKH